MNEGWVGIKYQRIKDAVEGRRRIAKIERADTREYERIYCEAFYADALFLHRYKAYCKDQREAITKQEAATCKETGNSSCCSVEDQDAAKQEPEGCQDENRIGKESATGDVEYRIYVRTSHIHKRLVPRSAWTSRS
jgi:hypothetical protein